MLEVLRHDAPVSWLVEPICAGENRPRCFECAKPRMPGSYTSGLVLVPMPSLSLSSRRPALPRRSLAQPRLLRKLLASSAERKYSDVGSETAAVWKLNVAEPERIIS